MKLKVLLLATSFLLTSAAHAAPVMVAGWDFSQYAVPGFLTIDGGTFVDTLDANFSDLDTTGLPGLGAGADVFGTMFIDGTFGSTATPLDGSDLFSPQTPSLASNSGAPTIPGLFMDGTSQASLQTDGQAFWNDVHMSVLGLAIDNVALTADVTGSSASNWILSLGAVAPQNEDIGVQVSFDGGLSFANAGTINVTASESAFNLNLGGTGTTSAIVRLDYLTAGVQAAYLADLSSVVPEPGTLLLLVSGLTGLAIAGRRS